MRAPGLTLVVDLSTGLISTISLSEQFFRTFLGGRGLAAALCYDLIPEGCDPLGPQNVLSICTGLLTGTEAPASGRTHFCALSPQTGILGSSNAGGRFGPALRSLGLQGLVITGRSPRPVYLYVDSYKAELRDAGDLWGLDAWRSDERLKERSEDSKLRVMTIGAAGENRSAMACILIDVHSAAGRTGLGAVMGAKNLKAVAVKAEDRRPAADPARRAAARAYIEAIRDLEMYRTVGRYGQSGYVEWCNELGMLSTRNYASGRFDRASAICGSNLGERVVQRRSCHRCPIHCKAEVKIAAGRHSGERGPRPEFESIVALGSKCGQGDPDAVLHLSNLCGRLGLDTISAGSVLAFAMELWERGVVGPADTGGLELDWGNAESQAVLLEQIARHRGFGAVLADGVRRAAERIGRGSERFAYHVKGLELCAYDPRGALASALGYAVSGRGGDYAFVFPSAEHRWDEMRAARELGRSQAADPLSPSGKAEMVRRTSLCSAVVDSLGLCKVPALGIPAAFDLKREAKLASALTGRDFSPEDLFRAGERIVNLERLFSLRFWQGEGPFDSLPAKFRTEALPDGRAEGRTADPEPMLAEYYRLMHWTPEGIPEPARLEELGLPTSASTGESSA